jgi:hypothetical protein
MAGVIQLMRKMFSIIVALIIILTGMHLRVATHLCWREVAAIKVSFSGKKASCGMESDLKVKTSSKTGLTSHCCDNEMAVYSVDNNYMPSVFHFKEVAQPILHEFYIPGGFSFHADFPLLKNLTNVSPPYHYLASNVCMAGICVFRI